MERTTLITGTVAIGSGVEGFEPARRPLALLNAPMVRLQVAVERAVGPVQPQVSKDVSNGTRVGIVAIGGEAVWRHPGHRPRLAEEGLRRGEVPGGAEPGVDYIPSTINRPVPGLPLALAFDIRLVDRPAFAHGTIAPPAQGLMEERTELAFPLSHRFMCKDETALEEHLRQVPQAQFMRSVHAQLWAAKVE
jgi:hypothetical protein